jgi:DNA-binding MarR family transcriptional regulator
MAERLVDDGRVARDLRIAIGRVSGRLRKLYSEKGAASDPTFTELAILRRLQRDGPTSPGRLANRERVTAQWIGIVVNSLTERGLVARAADPSDHRSLILQITDDGHGVLENREHRILERLAEALQDGFDAAERERIADLVRLLDRLADRL